MSFKNRTGCLYKLWLSDRILPGLIILFFHYSNKTVGTDMVRMIQTFCKGMYIHVEKVRPSTGVADEPDYGVCRTTIGKKLYTLLKDYPPKSELRLIKII